MKNKKKSSNSELYVDGIDILHTPLDDISIDSIETSEILRLLFARCFAITYPKKTLSRRIALLTDAEKKRILKLWQKTLDNLSKIEMIISDRADKENDSWP